MSNLRRDPYAVLGLTPAAPRAVIDKEYRRGVLREHRLLDHDVDAVQRLHQMNEAYAAITRPKLPDPKGHALVAILLGALVVGYLLDIRLRIFVLAPVLVGVAGLLWFLDTVHGRLTAPKAPTPTAASVSSRASILVGGPLEELVVPADVEPPRTGAYLVQPLCVGDEHEPIGFVPAGSRLPFAETFVLSAADQEDRFVTIPISLAGQVLESVRIHARRPVRAGDLIEISLAIGVDGRVELAGRDPYGDASMRVEIASPLLVPVAVAGYRG